MTQTQTPPRRVYGSRRYPEDMTRCVESVRDGYYEPRQCARKRGYGEAGEYCRQHAKWHPAAERE